MNTLVDPIVEQRRSPRILVYAAGTISAVNGRPSDKHIAWIKDINQSGLCLFTRYRPLLGTPVRVTLESDPRKMGRQQHYEGKVVRVQEFGSQAALAVAVRFANQIEDTSEIRS